jgi:hypothetical protein
VDFENAMNNWNISTFDTKDDDVTGTDRFFTVIGQEKEITTEERGFHTSTENERGLSLTSNEEKTNLKTTTIGLSLPVTTIRPFQIINAVEMIIPKFKT